MVWYDVALFIWPVRYGMVWRGVYVRYGMMWCGLYVWCVWRGVVYMDCMAWRNVMYGVFDVT